MPIFEKRNRYVFMRLIYINFNAFLKINLILLVISGSLWLYYTYNPSDGFFPRCPTNQYLGFLCPGCGSQRAVHQLLHANVGEAFKANPLLITSLPYVLLALIFENKAIRKKYSSIRKVFFGRSAIIVILIIIILFTIFRNIH